MRFAVAGDSPSVTGLLQAIAVDPDHELAAMAAAPRLHAALRSLAPSVRMCGVAEELLSVDRLDALIVAADDDETLGVARRMAFDGKALLVDPAAGQSATFAYEMTLLQAEQPACLVPLFVLRAHPLVAQLRRILAAGGVGDIRHVLLERRLMARDATVVPHGLSTRDIASAFLPDADLLRSIWGEYDTVTAVRTGDAASGISLTSITLKGPVAPQVVWTATAAEVHSNWRLHVVGANGTATLTDSAGDDTMSLETSIAGLDALRETATFDGDRWLLTQFAAAIPASSQPAPRSKVVDERGTLCPNWEDFTRAVELLDASERSIKRRRTIEIQFETPSERGQFKTQMTAAGCSLLVMTLVAVVIYLTVNSLIDLNVHVKQLLVALIFLPLGLFLALQGLLFLARPSGGRREDGGSKMEDGGQSVIDGQ